MMIVLAFLLCVYALPASLYLLLLTVSGALRPRVAAPGPEWEGRLALVVPAHDEAAGIARTVTNLVQLAARDGHTDVVVIADNCEDDTAEVARQHGARVIERVDPAHRGKGYALDHAFRTLDPEGYAAYAVVDADTVAADNFVDLLRREFGRGARALQVRYGVLGGDASARSGLLDLALSAFNVLRPRGRERLGLSVGILGNGFALRREVLHAVPYTAASVVEDLEYHLRLIAAGVRVHHVDGTSVRGEMPTSAHGRQTQRARWEGGRLRMLREHFPNLLRQALRGRLEFWDPLFDLLLLPLAYHALLLIVLIPLSLPIALFGLGVLGLHVGVAARVGGIGLRRLALLLTEIPLYMAWKLGRMPALARASGRGTRWVRSERTRRT